MKVSSKKIRKSSFQSKVQKGKTNRERSRQAKWKDEEKKKMYVTIEPKNITPYPIGKLVTLEESTNEYDLYDGEMHFKGKSINDLFLDSMMLMEKWQEIFIVCKDAWHNSDRIIDVILKSENLRPNQPKVEPNYFELKAYTKEGKIRRKSITAVSTSNYLGAKEDEFSEDTMRETTEKMYSFFQQKMVEFGECFGYSTAKIAWNKWVMEYLPHTIMMPKVINREIQNHIRGGRIQAFERGHRSYGEQVDFNSLYGYIAENRLVSVEPIIHPLVSGILKTRIKREDDTEIKRPVMPLPLFPKDVATMVKLVEQGQKQKVKIEKDPYTMFITLPYDQFRKANRLLKKYGDYKLALVNLLTPNAQVNYHFFISWEYPDKPLRIPNENHGSEGLTNYYRGQGRVTGIELKRMYEEGAKIQIHSYSAYRSEKIFGTFASDFYKKRQDSEDKLNKAFYKLLIVGLVGRMGMKLPKRRSVTSGHIDTREIGKVSVEDLLRAEANANGRIPLSFSLKDKGNSLATVHSNFVDITTNTKSRANIPIVFEEITAYGRDLMYGLMKLVDEKFGEGTTSYTHTDSLLFNKPGVVEYLKSLGLIGEDLGQSKPQHRGPFEIHGTNDLVIHDIDTKTDHWVHGGISNEAILIDGVITNVRPKTARSPELVPKSKKLSELRSQKNNKKLNFVKESESVKIGYPLESMVIPERRLILPHPSGKKNLILMLPDYVNTMSSGMSLILELNKLAKKR